MTKKGTNDPHIGEALVLTCMDLRVTDDIARFFATKGAWWKGAGFDQAPTGSDGADLDELADEYDHVSLAGAALAAMGPVAYWRRTIWNHLALAKGLHAARRLIIVEHQDCGAYRKLIEPASLRDVVGADKNAWKNPLAEAKLHYAVASAMKAAVNELLPDWKVDIFYAALPDPKSLHGQVRPFTDEEKNYALETDPVTSKPEPDWVHKPLG